ncbi:MULTISPECIES: DUF6883 domain-containing protein [Methylobacterium]|uniref:DUF6883 domain-containing protein n=1 Tax=Methylobacterium TaxID=407 RepID=UPI0013EA8541|nr:DUF6883 domain-containing protein [Methylobacterium sp. DB0501]NGM34607.1 hypothetical protein [Methylobacterium sp. DB0501]
MPAGLCAPLNFVIPFPKLIHSRLHAEGAAPAKAKLFVKHGFHRNAPTEPAQALWRHAKPEHSMPARVVPFGLNLVFEGPIRTPNGTEPSILSAWHVPAGNPRHSARLVTAYPS